MSDETLPQQLAALRNLLSEVDARLTRAPAAATGLEDLKRSVDTLRTNIWAILSAGRGANSPALVERFKLRRAIDGIRAVRDEITSGVSTTLHPEHTELQVLLQELAGQIGKLR